MQYNIWFDICGVMILAILMVTFYIKYNIPVVQYRLFKIMMWTVFLSTLSDLLAGLWENHILAAGLFSPAVLKLVYLVYFLSRNATPVIFLLYLLTVTNIRERTEKGMAILLAPFIAAELLVLSSPLTGWVFYIDENGVYHRGGLLLLVYTVAAGYMVFALFQLIAFRKLIQAYQYAGFLFFEIITLLTVLIQWKNQHILIENFGSVMCVLLMYMAIQKPEEILDGVTGFLRKNVLSDICRSKLKQKKPFTILVLILKDYDFLEKSYGIETMDKILAQAASLLRKVPGTTACRMGEKKLCLLGNSQAVGRLEKAGEEICKQFSKPWSIGEYNIVAPVNCGIIRCPEDASSFREIVELMENMAGMERKEEKKVIHAGEMDISRIHRKYQLETLVKEAVERGLLEVVYQPIYNPKKKRFSSAEALLRMKEETLGNISPVEFIPIAEKNGSIVKIGKYVLSTVCDFIAEHDLEQYGLDYIEINLSPVECLQEDMTESIMEQINVHGIRPEQINLEITETAISFLPESVDRKMRELLAEGVTFSLDDYGTGYSNLSRLAALPLEITKIDKSIVQEAFVSENMKVVLDNTLHMIAMMNKKILAEGVEKKEQADYLIERGCDYIQGYYYSKPVSKDEFIELLEKQKY